MTCSCGFENARSADRCGRCGWILHSVAVDVLPPRAGGRALGTPWRNPLGNLQLNPPGEAAWPCVVAGIVPGLGHALAGMPWRGLLTLLAQAFLIAQIIYFAGTTWGNLVVALALFHHGHSIFMLVRRRFRGMATWPALVLGAGLFLAPTMLIYGPAYELWRSRYELQFVNVALMEPLMRGDVVVVDRRGVETLKPGDLASYGSYRLVSRVLSVEADQVKVFDGERERTFQRSGIRGRVVRIWQPVSRRGAVE